MIVLSANAHISSCDGYVSYFREITEGGPFIGRVCISLVGLLLCFLHVVHIVIPEVSVCLCLSKEAELRRRRRRKKQHQQNSNQYNFDISD